jgi:hypothetical protein
VILIEHTHAGTVIHGTTRGDGSNLVIKSTRDGWRFSRTIGPIGAWYLPHTRDRDADRTRIERLADALHAAGYQVEIRIDNTPRPAAAVEADRAQRVAGRIERYTELADARHEHGNARLDHVRERRSHIPLGQPVLGPRDASYRRRLSRAEDSARNEIAVGDHWQHRAEAAESTKRYRHNPRVITRRIERLEADLRRWQRARATVASGGAYEHTAADYLARADTEIARLTDEITYWRGELAAIEATGAYRPWTRDHFQPGDEALISGTWCPVLRVNAKSVTVPPLVLLGERRLGDDGTDVWTDTAPYDTVYGRRREGKILHTPPPPADAGCTEPASETTGNADEAAEPGRVCGAPPVLRVTVCHDGTSCGCGGLCLDNHRTAGERREPWTEVRLLCADHTAAYEAGVLTDPLYRSPAGTVEHLQWPRTAPDLERHPRP